MGEANVGEVIFLLQFVCLEGVVLVSLLMFVLVAIINAGRSQGRR